MNKSDAGITAYDVPYVVARPVIDNQDLRLPLLRLRYKSLEAGADAHGTIKRGNNDRDGSRFDVNAPTCLSLEVIVG